MSGSQLQSLCIRGDCSVTSESEQTQLCGRSGTISRCELEYPMSYSQLKFSVSIFASTSPDDPLTSHLPFQTSPMVTFEWPLYESQKDLPMSSAEGEKWMRMCATGEFSTAYLMGEVSSRVKHSGEPRNIQWLGVASGQREREARRGTENDDGHCQRRMLVIVRSSDRKSQPAQNALTRSDSDAW